MFHVKHRSSDDDRESEGREMTGVARNSSRNNRYHDSNDDDAEAEEDDNRTIEDDDSDLETTRDGRIKIIDWAAIENDFRKSLISYKALARKYGVADVTIARRAKKYIWQRDLSTAVRRQVRAQIVADAVQGIGNGDSTSDDETRGIVESVAAATDRGVAAVRDHLKATDRLKSLRDKAADLLDRVLDGDKDARSLLMQSKMDSIVSALRAIADVSRQIQLMERQSLSLDDEASGDGSAAPLTVQVAHFDVS